MFNIRPRWTSGDETCFGDTLWRARDAAFKDMLRPKPFSAAGDCCEPKGPCNNTRRSRFHSFPNALCLGLLTMATAVSACSFDTGARFDNDTAFADCRTAVSASPGSDGPPYIAGAMGQRSGSKRSLEAAADLGDPTSAGGGKFFFDSSHDGFFGTFLTKVNGDIIPRDSSIWGDGFAIFENKYCNAQALISRSFSDPNKRQCVIWKVGVCAQGVLYDLIQALVDRCRSERMAVVAIRDLHTPKPEWLDSEYSGQKFGTGAPPDGVSVQHEILKNQSVIASDVETLILSNAGSHKRHKRGVALETGPGGNAPRACGMI